MYRVNTFAVSSGNPIPGSHKRSYVLPSSRSPNGFLGPSLDDRTILFLLILLDKTVSVG